MKKVTLFLFLVFLVGSPLGPSKNVEAFILGTLNPVLSTINGVFKLANNIKDLTHSDNTDDRFGEVLGLINEVSAKIDDLSYQVSESTQQMLDAVYSLKNYISLEIDMNEYQKNRNQIDINFIKMERMSKNIESYENITLLDFASSNLRAGSDSVSFLLYNAFFTYFGNQKLEKYQRLPLVDKIDEEFKYEEKASLCSKVSAQQYFYIDYIEMLLTEIRGNILMSFSVNILREHNKGNFTTEAEDFIAEQDSRIEYMTEKLKKVISQSSQEIRQCDPENHVLGKTYDQLTKVYQGIVINVAQMQWFNWCDHSCSDYSSGIAYNNCHKNDDLCRNQYVFGFVTECQSDDRNEVVHISRTENDDAHWYNYFETNRGSSNGHVYGEKTGGKEVEYRSFKVGNQYCTYCHCYYEEIVLPAESDRYFSLDEVVSDVNNNKAVIGVRFVKFERVFHLQILQAIVGPLSQVNASSMEWKSVKPTQNLIAIGNVFRKGIDLDNVVSKDPTFIVTGVRMGRRSDYEMRIRLEVRLTKYDVETGALDVNSTKWISNTAPNSKQAPKGRKNPLKSPMKSVVASTDYNYVDFTGSDFKTDAGRSIVPFMDVQGVVSGSPVPLNGVGLYHKGYGDYAGFIAPRIFSYDYINMI
ncbi:hypothetical protein ACFFRR_010675 [Megaselia abdita]